MPTSILTPARDREIVRVTAAHRTLEGDRVPIRRALPTGGLEAVGPFIFLDHIGPIDFGPGEARGAPEHPHRGFETLTYLLEGSGEHRDSLGNVSVIGAGEAQWMRAGSGILHDEGADPALKRDGGRVHGVQFWINLPRGKKLSPPAYRRIRRDDIPAVEIGDATVRMLAGTLDDARGPVETFADPWLAHVAMRPGAAATLATPAGEFSVYVAAGSVQVGSRTLGEGDLGLLGPGDALALASDEGADVFVLGGPPLDAPLRRYGPFVMNTDAELDDAVRDFQAGRFGTIPGLTPRTDNDRYAREPNA